MERKKISEILTSTEDVFNTGREIVPVFPDDFKFFEKIKIESSLASNQFIQDSYFFIWEKEPY